MNAYPVYHLVQAEQAAQRARSSGVAQRQADAQVGELAAAVAQCFRALRRPAAAVRAAAVRPAAVRAALRRGLRGEAVTDQ